MFNSLSDLIITMCPHSIAKLLIELQKRARTYGKYVNIYIYTYLYIKYTNRYFRLPPGRFSLARPAI